MTTKKFNTFEYAALVGSGKPGFAGVHSQDAFETPLGHVFVVVSNDHTEKDQSAIADVVLQRIRYYMEHEPEACKEDVTKNALIYTSGYIYQHCNKEASGPEVGFNCLCLLFCDDQIHYSWIGDIGLYLFTGKRMHWLNWQGEQSSSGMRDGRGQPQGSVLLGQQAIIDPESNHEAPLKPVNGDKLILTSGSVSKRIHTKETKRVLKDSMPLQTKVARILRHTDPGQQSGALTIIRFHAVSNKERVILRDAKTEHPVQPVKNDNMTNNKKENKKQKKKPVRVLKTVLMTLGFLAVVYFIYDLFIYDPHPPVSISITQPEVGPEESIHVPEEVVEEASSAAAIIPDDHSYTVRSGDTWGRIYAQFGVCSWFIRNHPPNTGRFGSQGSLIAGQRLQIPLLYSGDPQLNPHYYTEFTTEKVGSGCQNVDRDFLEAFEERIQQ